MATTLPPPITGHPVITDPAALTAALIEVHHSTLRDLDATTDPEDAAYYQGQLDNLTGVMQMLGLTIGEAAQPGPAEASTHQAGLVDQSAAHPGLGSPPAPDWPPASQQALAAAQQHGAMTGPEWTVLLISTTSPRHAQTWPVQATDPGTAAAAAASLCPTSSVEVAGVIPGTHHLADPDQQVASVASLAAARPALTQAVRGLVDARLADLAHGQPRRTSPDLTHPAAAATPGRTAGGTRSRRI